MCYNVTMSKIEGIRFSRSFEIFEWDADEFSRFFEECGLENPVDIVHSFMFEGQNIRAYRMNGSEDHTLVGFGGILEQKNGVHQLNSLCVLPSERHKGIGRALVKIRVDIADGEYGDSKMPHLVTTLGPDNSLQAYYEELGFVQVASSQDFVRIAPPVA
jgi:N-acetylglutamate synthase-like GNAT family acetyltransferase